MEYLTYLIDLFLHLDKHLNEIIQNFGVWTYAILFLIIFLETDVVVTPFLPDDSLLFAAGAFAALGSLNVLLLFLLLFVAAVFGRCGQLLDLQNQLRDCHPGHHPRFRLANGR